MTDTRQVLEEAWEHLCQTSLSFRRYACTTIPGGDGWTMTGKFCRFLDAEAWTDAALMLIPTDGSMKLLDIECSYEPNDPGVWSACTIRWYPPHKSGNDWHARIESGPIPALALAQAALRAKEAGDV